MRMSDYKHQEYALGFQVVLNEPKTYEPIARKHGNGLRHHGHRFPIKGGISKLEACVNNAYLELNENFYNLFSL